MIPPPDEAMEAAATTDVGVAVAAASGVAAPEDETAEDDATDPGAPAPLGPALLLLLPSDASDSELEADELTGEVPCAGTDDTEAASEAEPPGAAAAVAAAGEDSETAPD